MIPLPEVAAAVIGRWVWHYRSELAPGSTAVGVFAVAWLLHRWHPGWWPLIACLAAACTAMPIAAGSRLGLPPRAERWYAALVIAVAGGWLAAAMSPGQSSTTPPCHAILNATATAFIRALWKEPEDDHAVAA